MVQLLQAHVAQDPPTRLPRRRAGPFAGKRHYSLGFNDFGTHEVSLPVLTRLHHVLDEARLSQRGVDCNAPKRASCHFLTQNMP